MTKARNIANLLDANGQIDNADIAGGVNFKNIIINGDMSIAQRGTSQASAGSSGGSYQTLDRWKLFNNNLGVFTWSQDTDVPTGQGFANSMKFDCTTADGSPAAGDYLYLSHPIEGQNLQYIKKGTANAESLTASFWVKSDKTGTYIVELFDIDNSRIISKSYTIDSASTWEKKTITFAGDTTGTLDNDNARSFQLDFWLAAGSNFTSGTLQNFWGSRTDTDRAVGQVNLADDTANNFWITGVQLEAGTTASDFEFLPHDVNLLRCQRYYQILAEHGSDGATTGSFGTGVYYTTSDVYGAFPTIVNLRTQPTIDQVSGTNYYVIYRDGTADFFDDFVLGSGSNSKYVELRNSADVSGTAGDAGFFRTSDASAFIAFDAEI